MTPVPEKLMHVKSDLTNIQKRRDCTNLAFSWEENENLTQPSGIFQAFFYHSVVEFLNLIDDDSSMDSDGSRSCTIDNILTECCRGDVFS